jgi:hypothetical protein
MRHSPPLGGCGWQDHYYNGLNEVFDYLGRLQQSGPAFILEVHSLLADDEHGVALPVGTAERASKRIKQKVVHDFHLNADGKITGWWTSGRTRQPSTTCLHTPPPSATAPPVAAPQQDRWVALKYGPCPSREPVTVAHVEAAFALTGCALSVP